MVLVYGLQTMETLAYWRIFENGRRSFVQAQRQVGRFKFVLPRASCEGAEWRNFLLDWCRPSLPKVSS